MDLTAQAGLVLAYSIDANTGLTTVTFKDVTGTTTLGEIIIETLKHRSLIEGLGVTAREYFGDREARTPQRLVFDKNANVATMVFG